MPRIVMVQALLAAGAVLGAFAPASAQVAAPQRKAGMWEITMTMAAPRGMTMKSQMCTDAATEKKVSALGGGGPGQTCTNGPVRKTATGFTFEGTCKTPQGTTTVSGVASGDFQSNYKIDMISRMTPAPAGMPPTMTSTIAGRWLGPCPAGRKPGDMVMPNGMVVNMLAAAGSPR